MTDQRRLVWWLPQIAVVGLALGLSDCSEELGPARMAVARVKGVVREGSQPVSSGWIEFYPVQGTVGNLRSARLRPDGSFEAERVPVGTNLIRLVNVPLSSAGAKQVFGAYTSPIRRVISAQSTETIVVDLVDEAIRYRSAQSTRTNPAAQGPGESR
jgi:hypothetical protein